MGFGLEVDMIRQARELDLLTTPVRLQPGRGAAMAEGRRGRPCGAHGADDQGAIGAKTALTLDESVARVQAMHDAAKAEPRLLVLCHGGPIAEPEDARTSSSARAGWRASTAPPAWSGCRRKWRSRRTCGGFKDLTFNP